MHGLTELITDHHTLQTQVCLQAPSTSSGCELFMEAPTLMLNTGTAQATDPGYILMGSPTHPEHMNSVSHRPRLFMESPPLILNTSTA